MEEKVFIGFAKESITPDKSVNLDGQFYERVSESVETPVFANVMAIKVGDEQMIIASCDLMNLMDSLAEDVRAKVKGYKGIDTSKILIHATHTHTSVGYSAYYRTKTKVGGGLRVLTQYAEGVKYLEMKADREAEMGRPEAAEFLAEHIAKAIKDAWDNLHPAYYQFGFGRAAVGLCRRAVFDDGSAQMWGDTSEANFKELEDGTDSGIEMAFIFDEAKKLEGVLLNVACPAQVMGQRSVISSDYWGKLRILLREKFGEDLNVIATCAPAGDLCPRDLTRWVAPETPIKDPNINRPRNIYRRADPSMFDVNGTWKAAKRIFHEVCDTFEELPEGGMKNTACFEHKVMDLPLPYRKVTLSEYNMAQKAVKDFVASAAGKDINFEDTAKMHVYAGILARYENQQDIDVYPTEVHVARFDDVAITSSPFELFHNFGNQIRCRSYAAQTFQIQMTNGYYGYLPTEKAEHGSHYSAYVSSGHVGHEGGDILVRTTVSEINKMFK